MMRGTIPVCAVLAAGVAAPAIASDAQAPVTAPQAQPFIDSAEGWLLGGQSLPSDYRQQLLAMDPDQRLQALVWLRRSGLLVDRAWSVDDLMRPAARVQKGGGDEPRKPGR